MKGPFISFIQCCDEKYKTITFVELKIANLCIHRSFHFTQKIRRKLLRHVSCILNLKHVFTVFVYDGSRRVKKLLNSCDL